MKHLLIILVVLVGGCATTHNIYDMDIVDDKVTLVDNVDDVLVVLVRESSLSRPTLQNEFINYNRWQVTATNKGDACVQLKLLWNLSGFVYQPTKEYTPLIPNTTTRIGYITDEVVTYGDFTYPLKGYGRIKELKTKFCSPPLAAKM